MAAVVKVLNTLKCNAEWAELVRLEMIEDVGRAAYYRDVPRSANPYELESERHAWEVGWLLGAFLGTGGVL